MNQASTGWPPASGITGWGQVPANLMPKRTQAWPRGTQSAANDAERLLSQAVGWWDAAWYDGSRFLRNRGVAGELLDMRLGSSLAPNSNDPLYLAPQEVGYVYTPGVSGNGLSVPDENALDITGDIDIRVRIAMDDWTPGAASTLIAKWAGSGTYSWIVDITTAGLLRLYWSTNGTAVSATRTATAATNLADGSAAWVRVTLDVDNAGQNETRFYTSTDGVTWTQVGDPVSAVGVTSIYSGSAALTVGYYATFEFTAAKVYRAIVKDGIDGTTVLDVDCDVLTSGSATSFTATTGQTVTINRATTGRKTVAQPARGRGGRALFLLGTDDYFEVQDNWQHQLLNFGQGNSFTVLVANRSWNTTSSLIMLSKADTVATTITGYAIPESGANYRLTVGDGTRSFADVGARAAGTMNVVAGVRNQNDRSLIAYLNATAGTVQRDTSTSLANQFIFRVGRLVNTYSDMEFTAAAVWRLPMTADEVTAVTNYLRNRGF